MRTVFGGVVFCRKDRDDIQSADDLKNKRFMAVMENSFGGWQMAWREFRALGMEPRRKFKALTFGGTQDAVVCAVRDREVDAGTVRTGTLERMASEGLIRLDDFRVLRLYENDGRSSSPGVLCSTRLYPEWPFAKSKHVPIDLAEHVARALLHMSGECHAACASSSMGWTIPLDYQPVHDCLRDLQIGPYEYLGREGLSAVLRQYAPWVAVGVAFIVALLAHTLQLRHMNARQRRISGMLRQSEQRYRILSDYSTDFVYWRTPDGALAYVSPSVEALTGYSPADFAEQPGLLDNMVHPEDRPLWDNHFRDIKREDPQVPLELRIVTKSGEVRWIGHACCTLEDDQGQWLGVRGRDVDITKRKKAEHQAARAAACAEAVNQILRGALTCTTEEELGKTCLAVAEDLTKSEFGYFGFLNSQGLFDIVAVSKSGEVTHDSKEGRAAASSRNMSIRGINQAMMRDGESRIVNDPASGLHDIGVPEGHPPIHCYLGAPLMERGRTIGMIGLSNKPGGYDPADRQAVESLSDAVVAAFQRRWAEEALQRRNDELARFNADLEKAKASVEEVAADLERSNKELDDFAYIASHDLKEPLRGIYSYSNFLLEDYADRLDEEGRSKLERLPRLAKRLEAFIDSLLEFSRVGRTELGVGETDLNEVLAEVLDSLHVMQQEAAVDVRIPEPLPAVTCDRLRVGEVFRNLITNAIKYNDKPERWIEIGCLRDRAEQHADVARSAGPVFYVRDNGIGIPKKHIDSVFRIFKRLHGREKYGGGTGAGLTIVKKIVERHGGQVWVESIVGEGTAFYFTLQGPTTHSNGGRSKHAAEVIC